MNVSAIVQTRPTVVFVGLVRTMSGMDRMLQSIAQETFAAADWNKAHHVDHGQFHDVLVLPEVAVVRIARTREEGLLMAKRMDLLRRINDHVTFLIPVPLTDVQWHLGRAAVAQQYIPGTAHPSGSGDVEQLRALVETLQGIDISVVSGLTCDPFSYAGPWNAEKRENLFAGAPADIHPELHRRLDALLAMDAVEPSLVHGDLAGYNIHWRDGRLLGVLDWDLASSWDPAINIAYLSMWHGPEIATKITDPATAARARIWRDSLILESMSRAIADARGERVETLAKKLRGQH